MYKYILLIVAFFVANLGFGYRPAAGDIKGGRAGLVQSFTGDGHVRTLVGIICIPAGLVLPVVEGIYIG